MDVRSASGTAAWKARERHARPAVDESTCRRQAFGMPKRKLTGQGGAGRGQGRKRTLPEAIRVTTSFVLSEEEHADLERRAREAGLSRSSFVRRALGYPPVR
jgi:hypothetical protein